jgi:hypothetical protein
MRSLFAAPLLVFSPTTEAGRAIKKIDLFYSPQSCTNKGFRTPNKKLTIINERVTQRHPSLLEKGRG